MSYDNGQIDPNISSQYDLIELLANRTGPLPQDRPHYIKLDAFYNFDFKRAGDATIKDFIRDVVGHTEDRHHIGEPGFVQPERTMSCIGG